jgi:hypothetical protein
VTVASSTALATVTGVLVAYAVNADGYPVHRAELDDGGIWITNQSMGAVGRQNVPVAQIDGRVFDGTPFAAAPELDVIDPAVGNLWAGTCGRPSPTRRTGTESRRCTPSCHGSSDAHVAYRWVVLPMDSARLLQQGWESFDRPVDV